MLQRRSEASVVCFICDVDSVWVPPTCTAVCELSPYIHAAVLVFYCSDCIFRSSSPYTVRHTPYSHFYLTDYQLYC